MKLNLLYLIVFNLICSTANAAGKVFYEAAKVPGGTKLQRDKTLGVTLERQIKDNFAAQLVITSDKTVFSRWNRPSEVFSFESSPSITKGEVFFPLFVYWNPKKDFMKMSKVTYILEILKPDGTIYAKENLEAGEGVINHEGALLVKNYLAVTIEGKDPYGIYKVNAYVRDEVAKNDLVLSSQFEVVRSIKSKQSLISEAELGKLVKYFYLGDKIEKFPIMLKSSDMIPGWYDRGNVWMYFLSEVFKKYPEKLPFWNSVFKELSAGGKQTVWDALWWAHTAKSLDMLRQIKVNSDGPTKKYVTTLLVSKFTPLEKMEIITPEDLDNNWAGFIASGNEIFVNNIIKQIKPMKGKTGIELQLIVSARWSLTSNCQQHQRVLAITEKAYVNENDPQKKKILEEIILEGRKTIGQ